MLFPLLVAPAVRNNLTILACTHWQEWSDLYPKGIKYIRQSQLSATRRIDGESKYFISLKKTRTLCIQPVPCLQGLMAHRRRNRGGGGGGKFS